MDREKFDALEKEELKFCEAHTSLFVAGTNLGLKLDPARRAGLKVWDVRQHNRVYIEWNGEIGWTPAANIVIGIPGKPKQATVQTSHPMVANVSASAQVETPYGHVHAGPGAGKKR